MPNTSQPQPPGSNLKWEVIDDFSPGIYSQSRYSYSLTNNPVPAKKGAAQISGTVGCIALPGGGLGPLPSVAHTFVTPDNPGGQAFINGVIIHGLGPGSLADSIIYGWEYVSGGGQRSSKINVYSSAVDATVNLLSIAASTTQPGTGIAQLSGGITRVNPTAPYTTPGQPVVWLSYVYNGTPVAYYNILAPDPSAPGTLGYAVLDNTLQGVALCHQNRCILLTLDNYQYLGNIGGQPTLLNTNEEFNYTDPPNSNVFGMQRSVFVQEWPVGYGAYGSIAAGELFLVKHQGGGVIVSGDLNSPIVTYLGGVMPTYGMKNNTAAQTQMGLYYISMGNGCWLWTGGNTSKKISQQLNDDFYNFTNIQQVSLAQWGDYVVMTNGWLYDQIGGGWWRLPDPGFDSPPCFYGSSVNGTSLFALAAYYNTGTSKILARYDVSAPSTSYTWQSYPLPETINRTINIRQVAIRAQGIGTVKVVCKSRSGSQPANTPVTVSFSSLTQPDIQLQDMGVIGASDVTLEITSTGTSGHPAPIVYSVGIGYMEDIYASAT